MVFGIDGHNSWIDFVANTREHLSSRLSTRFRSEKLLGLEQLNDTARKKRRTWSEFSSIWKDVGLIICPVGAHPIPPIDRWNYVSNANSFVIRNFPARPSAKLFSLSIELKVHSPGGKLGLQSILRKCWIECGVKRLESCMLLEQVNTDILIHDFLPWHAMNWSSGP